MIYIHTTYINIFVGSLYLYLYKIIQTIKVSNPIKKFFRLHKFYVQLYFKL